MNRRNYTRPTRKKRPARKKRTPWTSRKDLEGEEWLPYPLNTDYAISNKGRAKRLTRGKNTRPGTILSQHKSNSGYLYVTMVNLEGEKKKHYLHRCVCWAFHGHPPRHDDIANHIDLNKENNTPENLEWISLKENQLHARDSGAMVGKQKLVKEQVLEIKAKIADGISDSDIAKGYDVSASTIRSIRTGKTWSEFYEN